MKEQRNNDLVATLGHVVIAHNATGQIVARITSNRDLVGPMHKGCCVFKLKLDAVRIEVHHEEGPTSEYSGKPLAAVSHEDLPVKQRSV